MNGWRAHLVSREVLPFYLSLLILGGGALLVDALLHLLHVVWIGRWLGIPGTLLIIGSFGYSLARRKWIKVAAPAGLLRLHDFSLIIARYRVRLACTTTATPSTSAATTSPARHALQSPVPLPIENPSFLGCGQSDTRNCNVMIT